MTDFLNGGDGGTGIPPELLKRKNGLMQAILAIPEDQDAGMGTASAQPMNAGDGGGEAPKLDRIEDDKTRHPQGDAQPQSMVSGARPSLSDAVRMAGPSTPGQNPPTMLGGAQPDDLRSQMKARYDELNEPSGKPLGLLGKILLGATAPFGSLKGYAQAQQQGQQMRTGEREHLLTAIEAEDRLRQQEELEQQRMTQQERMLGERGAQQNELEQARQAQATQAQQASEQRLSEQIKAQGERQQQGEQAAEKRQERQFSEEEKLAQMRGVGNAANERSYQATLNRVDKLRQPVEQRLERLSRLEDTLNQNNPQADSLIAPELLTVMAGGEGSGLHMNEAAIASIVGGATNWERIKSQVMAWHADPSKPFAFQPAQRAQIRNLFTAIKQRVSQKAQTIEEESQRLADSNDPKDHRQIYNRLQKRLLDIDTGGGSLKDQVQAPTATGPNGHKIKLQGGSWVDAATGQPIQ